MVLRYVEDLNPEEWESLVKRLKEGPTREQKQFVKECIEYFKDSPDNQKD